MEREVQQQTQPQQVNEAVRSAPSSRSSGQGRRSATVQRKVGNQAVQRMVQQGGGLGSKRAPTLFTEAAPQIQLKPLEKWQGIEDKREGRNVDDTDAPPLGPYRGEVGGPQKQANGKVEFEADARAEVATGEMYVVRMGGKSGRWATYPSRTIEGAMAEAQDFAKRYAAARTDEAAHGFQPEGDDPRHDLALPSQWSDRDQKDKVWRTNPFFEVGVFRLAPGTPYIASQVAPQPEGEDLAAGVPPRMWRGGAMQIQIGNPSALKQVAVVPIPGVPRPDVAATSHSVSEQQSLTPGYSKRGTVIETKLPNGDVITGTNTRESILGVPTNKTSRLETSRVDSFELNRAAQSSLNEQIAFEERVIGLMEKEENPSASQNSRLAELRQKVAQRKSDLTKLHGNAEEVRVRAIVERNGLDVGDEPRRVVQGKRSTTSLGAGGVTNEKVTTHSGEYPAVLEERESTTVGLGGVTRNKTDTLTTDDPKSAVRSTTTQATTTNVGPSGVSRTESREHSTVDPTGTKITEGSSESRGVRVGGGRLTASQSSTKKNEVVFDGHTRGHERTREASASAIHGKDGSGVGAGASQETKTTRGGVEVGSRVGGNGAFTVNVEELPTDPRTLRITTKIHLGVSAGVSAKRKRKPNQGGSRVSGGISGHASGDLIYTRTLTEEEAGKYLGNLDEAASGKKPDGRPEYGLVARAKALRAQGGADLGAVFSADAMQSMSEGETMELDLSAGADVSGGVGAQSGKGMKGSIGFSGSAGGSTGRRIKVSRQGPNIVIRVTVRSETHQSGEGSAGYGVASASVGRSGSEGGSFAVSFHLDPKKKTFEKHAGQIASLMTERGLVRFADNHPRLVVSRTGGATEKKGETVGLGVGPVGIKVGQTSEQSSEVTTGAGTVTGTHTGSQKSGGEISIQGQSVLSGSSKSEISAEVSATEDNQADVHVTLTHSQSESDAGKGQSDVAKEFAGRDLLDSMADVGTTGLSGMMDRILTAQAVRLTEYDLDQKDVDGLVSRAGQKSIWGHAISRWQLIKAWEKLRTGLVKPRPKKAWEKADKTPDKRFAKKSAQAKALADFMAQYGEQGGRGAVVWVLREWNAGIGFDSRESTAKDLGTLREWPPSLSDTREKYLLLKKKVLGLNQTLQRMLPAPGADPTSALKSARAHCWDIRYDLKSVEKKIDSNYDYEQPRAQLEMSLEVQRQRRKVASRLRRFEEMAAKNQAMQSLSKDAIVHSDIGATAILAGSGGEEATSKELVEQRQQRHGDMEQREQMSLPMDYSTVDPAVTDRVEGLINALKGQATIYRILLNKAHAKIPKGAGGGAGFWGANRGKAVDHLIKAHKMHEEWIRQIKNLRNLYRAAGIPEHQWKVKPTAKDDPRSLDPDIKLLVQYYRMSSRGGYNVWWQQTAAKWTKEVNY